MPATPVDTPETEFGSGASDSWFHRALARRQAEDGGEIVISGARFNSFI
jgi:hypothetical protein